MDGTTDGELVSVNWDTNDSIIAISPYQYQGAQCVILESGALRCWGSNSHGQLGIGTTGGNYNPSNSVNVSFPVPFAPKHISTGYEMSCAVLENGDAYCWGYNHYVRHLGIGFSCNWQSWANGCNGNYAVPSPSLVELPTGSSAESIYVGTTYESPTCVVLKDGNAFCWGQNYH